MASPHTAADCPSTGPSLLDWAMKLQDVLFSSSARFRTPWATQYFKPRALALPSQGAGALCVCRRSAQGCIQRCGCRPDVQSDSAEDGEQLPVQGSSLLRSGGYLPACQMQAPAAPAPPSAQGAPAPAFDGLGDSRTGQVSRAWPCLEVLGSCAHPVARWVPARHRPPTVAPASLIAVPPTAVRVPPAPRLGSSPAVACVQAVFLTTDRPFVCVRSGFVP